MLIFKVIQGCEMKDFNGSVFFTLLKRKIWDKQRYHFLNAVIKCYYDLELDLPVLRGETVVMRGFMGVQNR